MSEVKMPTSGLDLPSNSINKSPDESPKQERTKIQKVIKGKVITKKKSLGRKFADTFFGENVSDVKGYIITDVVIPAVKDIISDVVTGSIEMLLFGERRGRSGSRSGVRSGSYTSYSSYSYSGTARNTSRAGSSGRTSRVSRYSIEDVILESRGEAEDVLGNMIDAIKDYGAVSVADLYDMVGIPGAFTDNAWGWFDLGNATVRRIREGYLLVLPKVESLK